MTIDTNGLSLQERADLIAEQAHLLANVADDLHASVGIGQAEQHDLELALQGVLEALERVLAGEKHVWPDGIPDADTGFWLNMVPVADRRILAQALDRARETLRRL